MHWTTLCSRDAGSQTSHANISSTLERRFSFVPPYLLAPHRFFVVWRSAGALQKWSRAWSDPTFVLNLTLFCSSENRGSLPGLYIVRSKAPACPEERDAWSFRWQIPKPLRKLELGLERLNVVANYYEHMLFLFVLSHIFFISHTVPLFLFRL